MSNYQVLVTQSILLLIQEEKWREKVSRLQDLSFFLLGELCILIFQHYRHLLTVQLQNRTFLSCKKTGTKRESCYQVKYLKTVGLRVCFFLWLLKASHPQIQTSRWLPETLWNQQAAWLGHIILVSWPLDSLMDFYFIWVWSKVIGEDFKVTDNLWTSMMAFQSILS